MNCFKRMHLGYGSGKLEDFKDVKKDNSKKTEQKPEDEKSLLSKGDFSKKHCN